MRKLVRKWVAMAVLPACVGCSARREDFHALPEFPTREQVRQSLDRLGAIEAAAYLRGSRVLAEPFSAAASVHARGRASSS